MSWESTLNTKKRNKKKTPLGGVKRVYGIKAQAALDANKTYPARGGTVYFGPILPANVNSLRCINSKCLPVQYSDKFYDSILKTPEQFTKMAYYNSLLVGAIGCRVEDKDGVKRLYIMTLSVLEAYRNRGIGALLVESILRALEGHTDVDSVYLHVQISNKQAVSFYSKFGFEITETIPDYYKKIEPTESYILSKKLFK